MQIVYIDLIPQDEKPIVKISQYDNDRLVRFMLLENKEEYTLSGNESIDVNIKKPDGNIVVITPEITANNYVDVLFTEQASACYGESIGELSIKENSTIIGTCNFILDVEKSPTCGGIQSATEIENLQTQIEDIITSEGYLKADDVAEVAISGDYNDLINKPNIDQMLLDLLPVESQTGNPCLFVTDIAAKLTDLIAFIVASGGEGTPSTPVPISGKSELNININGNTFTISFGQTVYGGYYDAKAGKIIITNVMIDMGDMYWSYNASYGFISTSLRTVIKGVAYSEIANVKCDIFKAVRYDDVTQMREDYAIGVSPTSYGFVVIADSDYTSEYAFNQYIRGHKLVYELNQPTEIDVSTLLIDVIIGSNTITSDGGGDVTASYKVSIQKYIDDRT